MAVCKQSTLQNSWGNKFRRFPTFKDKHKRQIWSNKKCRSPGTVTTLIGKELSDNELGKNKGEVTVMTYELRSWTAIS